MRVERGTREGRTYGRAYFCTDEGHPLWDEHIYRDSRGWRLKNRPFILFCSEVLFESSEVKLIKVEVPAQGKRYFFARVDGEAKLTHIETLFGASKA